MASKRIQELDALRGLAAMAVVLFHFSFRYYELFGESGVSGVDSADPGGLFRTGYLGVHLFFIVSGFVIFMTVDRTESPVDFVFSRFSRLYPTYWAGVLVTTLVVALGWLPNMRRTFGEVLVNLTMLHEFWGVRPVEGVYWTLTRELIFYGIVLTVFSLGLIRFWIPLAYSWLAIQSAANLAMWFVGDFPYRLRFWLLTEFCHLFVAGMAFLRNSKVTIGSGFRKASSSGSSDQKSRNFGRIWVSCFRGPQSLYRGGSRSSCVAFRRGHLYHRLLRNHVGDCPPQSTIHCHQTTRLLR